MTDEPKKEPAEDTGSEKREDELGPKMTFIEHLEELRQRIIRCLITVSLVFVVIYATSIQTVSALLLEPMREAIKGHGTFIFTAPAEKFMFDLKLAAVAAIFVSLPMLFYQFWAFTAPGLYKNERRYVGPLILFSTLFFGAGASFFYFIAFPGISRFFASFAESDWIQFMPKFSDTFSFVLILMVAFGAVFEMPLVVFVLARLGIVSSSFLSGNRKYAILIISILAAIFTPPDIMSMAILGVPMWILYEISVVVAWVFGKKQKVEEAKEVEESSQ